MSIKEQVSKQQLKSTAEAIHLPTASHGSGTALSSQFSLVGQSCLTLCDPMDCSTPGFPVRHQLLELSQTHVRQVSDAIQPSRPLSCPCLQSFPASGSLQMSQFFA